MKTPLKVAAVVGGIAGTVAAIHHFGRNWGATSEERLQTFPGDDLVDNCQVEANRAETIAASPEEVWPWLMQMGQDRAGFYSYEKLENAIGCEIEGSTQLRPEWAERDLGDLVTLAPGIGLEVVYMEEPRALVLYIGDGNRELVEKGFPQAFTWQFVLETCEEGTRFLVRERYHLARKRDFLTYQIVPVISAIMTQKMLRTIKGLAESSNSAAKEWT